MAYPQFGKMPVIPTMSELRRLRGVEQTMADGDHRSGDMHQGMLDNSTNQQNLMFPEQDMADDGFAPEAMVEDNIFPPEIYDQDIGGPVDAQEFMPTTPVLTEGGDSPRTISPDTPQDVVHQKEDHRYPDPTLASNMNDPYPVFPSSSNRSIPSYTSNLPYAQMQHTGYPVHNNDFHNQQNGFDPQNATHVFGNQNQLHPDFQAPGQPFASMQPYGNPAFVGHPQYAVNGNGPDFGFSVPNQQSAVNFQSWGAQLPARIKVNNSAVTEDGISMTPMKGGAPTTMMKKKPKATRKGKVAQGVNQETGLALSGPSRGLAPSRESYPTAGTNQLSYHNILVPGMGQEHSQMQAEGGATQFARPPLLAEQAKSQPNGFTAINRPNAHDAPATSSHMLTNGNKKRKRPSRQNSETGSGGEHAQTDAPVVAKAGEQVAANEVPRKPNTPPKSQSGPRKSSPASPRSKSRPASADSVIPPAANVSEKPQIAQADAGAVDDGDLHTQANNLLDAAGDDSSGDEAATVVDVPHAGRHLTHWPGHAPPPHGYYPRPHPVVFAQAPHHYVARARGPPQLATRQPLEDSELDKEFSEEGRFTKVEHSYLADAIQDYYESRGITREAVNDYVCGKARDGNIPADFWDEICKVLPLRTKNCIQRAAKRIFRNDQKKGTWDPEEERELRIAYDQFPNQWAKICDYVYGRTAEQCRDRWRNYTKNVGLRRGAWTQEEEAYFIVLIKNTVAKARLEQETKRKMGLKVSAPLSVKDDLNYNDLSDGMKGTRSRLHARNKWVKLAQRQNILKEVEDASWVLVNGGELLEMPYLSTLRSQANGEATAAGSPASSDPALDDDVDADTPTAEQAPPSAAGAMGPAAGKPDDGPVGQVHAEKAPAAPVQSPVPPMAIRRSPESQRPAPTPSIPPQAIPLTVREPTASDLAAAEILAGARNAHIAPTPPVHFGPASRPVPNSASPVGHISPGRPIMVPGPPPPMMVARGPAPSPAPVSAPAPPMPSRSPSQVSLARPVQMPSSTSPIDMFRPPVPPSGDISAALLSHRAQAYGIPKSARPSISASPPNVSTAASPESNASMSPGEENGRPDRKKRKTAKALGLA